MANEFQYDVFLSHSSKDKAVVRDVAARLKKDGIRVWLDEEQVKPGDSIPAKIEEGLEHSRVLVLCMSANAFGSDWAQLEAGTFRFRDPLNKERRFIPMRLDDAPIKGSLAQFLYINWCRADCEQEYAKLLGACRNLNIWPNSAKDRKVNGDRTMPSEQTGFKPEWVFQDLPDHQIQAYHRQLCDQYADLNSFDLLEMCGKWRQLAVDFTKEACASGRHGAHVLHDSSVDSITRLLETACAVRGLHNIDRLSRCLRRPDDGHLHNALALLDDLEARFRAEAIAKHDALGSEEPEKTPHPQANPDASNKQVRSVHSGSGDAVDDYVQRRRDTIQKVFSSFEAIHAFFFKVCVDYQSFVEVLHAGLAATNIDRAKYYEYINETGERLHEMHVLEGRLAVADADAAVRAMQQYRLQATEVNDMIKLKLPCKKKTEVNAVTEELFRRKDLLYDELAKALRKDSSQAAAPPTTNAPQSTSQPIGDSWSGLRGVLQQEYSTKIIKGILGKAGLPISKIEFAGTYKEPVLNEADKLVTLMDNQARNRFAVGCVQEIVSFERNKSTNLEKLGVASDGQILRELQRVLGRFGYDLRKLELM